MLDHTVQGICMTFDHWLDGVHLEKVTHLGYARVDLEFSLGLVDCESGVNFVVCSNRDGTNSHGGEHPIGREFHLCCLLQIFNAAQEADYSPIAEQDGVGCSILAMAVIRLWYRQHG